MNIPIPRKSTPSTRIIKMPTVATNEKGDEVDDGFIYALVTMDGYKILMMGSLEDVLEAEQVYKNNHVPE